MHDSGQGNLDLGVFGGTQFMVFQNEHKEEENYPDAIISLVVMMMTGDDGHKLKMSVQTGSNTFGLSPNPEHGHANLGVLHDIAMHLILP